MKKIHLIFPAILAALIVLFSLNYAILAVGDTGASSESASVSGENSSGIGDAADGAGDLAGKAEETLEDAVSGADKETENGSYEGNISTDDNGVIGGEENNTEPSPAAEEASPISDSADSAGADSGSAGKISWIGVVVTIIVVLAIICIIVALVPKRNVSGEKKN